MEIKGDIRQDFLNKLKASLIGPLKEDDAEELVTNQLSNFMIGVFRDNPWVLDMLKKYINES